jgi:hypothetical protein
MRRMPLLHHIKLISLVFLAAFVLMLSVPVSVDAANASQDDACNQLDKTIGNPSQECGTKGSAFLGVLNGMVLLISRIAGIVSVIMVIWGGFKYVTSGGDAAKVSAAKTTLLYALIGVAVAASAQLLAYFVLSSAK